ncbi:hypothetical protein Q3G72_006458 [Acer saccharum]|nr:hypothetical protein Q3G72_006458 [Acer saccharum]
MGLLYAGHSSTISLDHQHLSSGDHAMINDDRCTFVKHITTSIKHFTVFITRTCTASFTLAADDSGDSNKSSNKIRLVMFLNAVRHCTAAHQVSQRKQQQPYYSAFPIFVPQCQHN